MSLIMAILPADSIETALNNLAEADFPDHDISVVTAESLESKTIAKKLTAAGLAAQLAKQFETAIDQQHVFISILTSPAIEKSAMEMLQDYSPQLLTILEKSTV